MSDIKAVITGIGVLSPNGVGQDEYRDAIRSGTSGIRKIDHFATSKLHSKIAGFISDAIIEVRFPDEEERQRYDRATVFSLIASEMACADAGIEDLEKAPGRKGVVLGTAYGPIQSLEWAYERSWAKKVPYIKPSTIPRTMFNAAASEVAIQHGLRQFNNTVSAADASSLLALALAADYIRAGKADLLLVGGVDCPVLLEFFRTWDALRVLARDSNDQPERACRPFSINRSGMVLSEGCGFVVLESEEAAKARKARPYAEVAGSGQSNDALQIGVPRMETEAECMHKALEDAAIKPAAIEHIHAHGAAIPANDAIECAAIRKVFGRQTKQIPVSSVKSMIGHTLGASGILSVITVLLGMRGDFIAPTINHEGADPECNVDCVANEARPQRIDTALVNSFGFGGTNVSVILRRQ